MPHKTSKLTLCFLLPAILVLAALIASCGSSAEDAEEELPDQSTPEGLAELVYKEMQDSVFSCGSSLYFGEANINDYYHDNSMGVKVCTTLREDAENLMYTKLQNSAATLLDFITEDEGEMASAETLPYVEGTAIFSDDNQLHISRMVQHEGLWYVMVLASYIPNI